MALSQPSYIKVKNVASYDLGKMWDDIRASDDFKFDSSKILEQSLLLQPNAQIALGIGMYEWIFWCFAPHIDRPEPEQVLEAMWCGAYDPKRFTYIEFKREEWLGPILGPMWCAMMFATAMVGYREEGEIGLQEGLSYLPRLAVHVLPESQPFLEWLDQIIDKLKIFYLDIPKDPFENLFEENDQHPLVPREVLDPKIDFDINQTSVFINDFLSKVNPNNPFLKKI